jgi:DHA3 family macrolide efflux protein-like MFS transporter
MQSSVAPDMQGRVFSLVGSVSGAMAPIGLAIAGPISDLVGIQAWYVAAGVVTISMPVLGLFLPAVMNIETNNPNKPKAESPVEMTGGSVPEPSPLSNLEE